MFEVIFFFFDTDLHQMKVARTHSNRTTRDPRRDWRSASYLKQWLKFLGTLFLVQCYNLERTNGGRTDKENNRQRLQCVYVIGSETSL